MKKKTMILLTILLCAASMTGCGEDTSEKMGNSEILLIDASQSDLETTKVTTKTIATSSVKDETKSTTVKSSNATKTTVKAAASTTKTVNKSVVTVKKTASEEENTGEETANEDIVEESVEEFVLEEESTEAPISFSEDATLILGKDCTQYVTQNPYLNMTEGISCMGEGYDRTYDYGDYIVYSFADYAGTGDYVQEIDLITDVYSTYAGIHVGSTRADVEATYGITEDGKYPSSEGGFLMFLYEDDIVSLIMYCLD